MKDVIHKYKIKSPGTFPGTSDASLYVYTVITSNKDAVIDFEALAKIVSSRAYTTVLAVQSNPQKSLCWRHCRDFQTKGLFRSTLPAIFVCGLPGSEPPFYTAIQYAVLIM